LTILKAALNEAYRERLIPINDAWQRVKAFRKVDSARIRYLTDDEARRLVNACPGDFRALVVGGMMTGCRYGELPALVDLETLVCTRGRDFPLGREAPVPAVWVPRNFGHVRAACGIPCRIRSGMKLTGANGRSGLSEKKP
jgi:hypothetical protein